MSSMQNITVIERGIVLALKVSDLEEQFWRNDITTYWLTVEQIDL